MSRGKLSSIYYTATEAREKLELTEDAFQSWIKSGKITKIKPPVGKQGVFLRKEIDGLVATFEAFYLRGASHDLRFEKATPQTQQEEFKLAELNFGEKTHQFDDRRVELLHKNPEMSYYLWNKDALVASINIVPINSQGIALFEQGERGWLLGDYVEPYSADHPLQLVIIDCLTTPLVPRNRRAQYAMLLFRGLAQVFEHWAQQGIDIQTIYASGGMPDGQRLLEHAFTYIGTPRPGRRLYRLEVASSDWVAIQPYKRILAARNQHGE